MEQKLLHLLSNCRGTRELLQTHLQILIHGFQEDKFVLPELVKASTNLHSLDYGIQILRMAETQSVVVFNNMIKSCNQHNRRKDAFSTFRLLQQRGAISPNSFTFTFVLKSCKSPRDFQQGTQVHSQIVKSGFGLHLFVQNTLLDFYSKCSTGLGCVCKVFDEMAERDVVSCNSMINAYMVGGETGLALQMFESMPERNTVSWNSIITGLSKAGDMELANSVFGRMPVRDQVSWNAMISGYIEQGDMESAKVIFNRMDCKNVVSWTAMISGYFQIGDLAAASNLFDLMPVKNTISWSAMVSGYVQNHRFDEALRLFHKMLLDGEFKPNEATLVSVLSACAHLGAHEQGKWIDSYMKRNQYDLTTSLGNATIDMYAKCGDVGNAKQVFNQLKHKCIITWTTMISGLSVNGKFSEALNLFDEMCSKIAEPDDVIFITVLSACTHGGLVEEGKRVFNQMVRQYRIAPRIEHYGCMVDLLSRAGKLEEALMLIESMPMKPNAVIWATLLGFCKVYSKRELAEYASRKILQLEPSNSGYRVSISNLNAAMGRWEKVSNMWAGMREEGIEKVPGCSSIQVGMGVHEFLVKDTRHRQRKEIYETLDGLSLQMKQLASVHSATPCDLLYPSIQFL